MSRTNLLKSHFPTIRERHEVLEEIQSSPELCRVFESWEREYQEEFLDYCTGVRGVKPLYDVTNLRHGLFSSAPMTRKLLWR